jgi:hypothetical protein
MVWVTEKQLQGGTLTQSIICEKARAIYGEVVFWELERISGISINSNGENCFEIRAI